MNIFNLKKPLESITTIWIWLTNLCNLNCKHCYSRNMGNFSLTLWDIEFIISKVPNLESINYWTWESFLNKEFISIVKYVDSLWIKQALTTNWTTIEYLSDELLSVFDDIDISIDFPDGDKHDEWRGSVGLFDKAIVAIERCKKHNVNVSIVSVLMKNNCSVIKDFKLLLDKYDIMLRINLYKSVTTDEFTPNYDEFWDTLFDISKNFNVISCSEPILSIVCDSVKSWSLCGWKSLRIHPDWEISSCVYVKNSSSIDEFNHEKKKIPNYCAVCEFKDRCQWWCFGRRISNNRSGIPDMYCPFYNKREIPSFKIKIDKNSKDLIHSNYLCTFILR